eukprot:scaffold20224_cov53-Attheya_sp.AAC.10
MPIQRVGRWANKQSTISFKQQLQALKSSSTKQWSDRIVRDPTSLPEPVLIPQYWCCIGNLGQLLERVLLFTDAISRVPTPFSLACFDATPLAEAEPRQVGPDGPAQ